MEKTTPRLMAAAKEFNIGKDTLVNFLVGKGFSKDDLKPTAKLTEAMYNTLKSGFINGFTETAEVRIQYCITTKNPYLDIGRCGLEDEDFEEGSLLNSLLRRCTYLETLILSNSWYDSEKKEWENSNNEHKPNRFTQLPPAIAALSNLKKLVCCSYGSERLSTLRWGIKETATLPPLKNLQQLNLSYNQLTEIKGLEGLSRLQQLNLSYNQLTEIKGLEGLSRLQQLDLSGNQLTEIKGLEGLIGLQQLDLRINKITEIKGLETLTQLQELNLSNNKLTEIKELETLTQLQELNLFDNRLIEIKGLEDLTQLQKLNLSNNKLTEIKGLKTLTQLQKLNLFINEFTEIKGLKTLTQLHELNLSNNRLTEIKGLETLTQLQKLNLSNNKLIEIKGLEALTRLQELKLSNNKLTEIKGLKFILGKDESFNLFIYDNPILKEYGIELKPYENHLRFIKELLLRQKSANQHSFIYPLKVLMLGNHGAGKSSLVNYLTGNKIKGSTQILRIENHWLSTSVERHATPDVIFYDFGGQDFYHGLYRAFISPGSLQIIVFDSRTDENRPDKDKNTGQDVIHYNRHYWLGQKNYQEQNSKEPNADPYIMVQTFAGTPKVQEALPLSYNQRRGYQMSFFYRFQIFQLRMQ